MKKIGKKTIRYIHIFYETQFRRKENKYSFPYIYIYIYDIKHWEEIHLNGNERFWFYFLLHPLICIYLAKLLL